MAVFLLVLAILMGVADRVRGTGILGGNGRFLWGGSIALAFVACYVLGICANYWEQWQFVAIWACWIPIAAWLGETIPPGFCACIGRSTTSWHELPLKRWWPGYFFPEPSVAEYPNASYAQKCVCDVLGSAAVGLLRAVLIIAPSLLWGAYNGNKEALVHGFCVILLRAIFRPLAYTLGWVTPVQFGEWFPKRNTEWGEFFDGAFWIFALLIL